MSNKQPPQMRLSIVRHGQSSNNALAETLSFDDYMVQRSVEPPLSSAGHQQADRVAAYLAAPTAGNGHIPISQICASPMLRCLHTALPIGQALKLQPQIWLDLFEQGGMFQRLATGEHRAFPGYGRSQLQREFPHFQLPDQLQEAGWWSGGYEEIDACAERARQVAQRLRRLADAAPPQSPHLLLVSHGTFSDLLLKALCHQLTTTEVYYTHNNTAISCVDFFPTHLSLRFLNRTEHLPPHLLTE